ncbi:MAG: hypothetical protein GXP26_13970 [Planctomycetes bacterium]|nr:hypothetical protein [Planctomycetota bacterium]
MSAKARVLIVDSSSEAREILRTLLKRRGTETLEASAATHANEILERQQPDLVVYDADCDRSPSQEDSRVLGRTASRSDTPIVVLGTTKRHLSPLPTGQLVTKPYHYGSLIRRIEELLGSFG